MRGIRCQVFSLYYKDWTNGVCKVRLSAAEIHGRHDIASYNVA